MGRRRTVEVLAATFAPFKASWPSILRKHNPVFCNTWQTELISTEGGRDLPFLTLGFANINFHKRFVDHPLLVVGRTYLV